MSTILLTGGTGKTGRRIASKLVSMGENVRVGSRSCKQVDGCGSVFFDWRDEASFSNALGGADRVYLLAPTDTFDSLEVMKPFIDYALKSGVTRFVLLSATSLPKGGPMMGAVHQYLESNAREWAVLRPTWFMQNFSEQQHLETIVNEGVIYSATGDGRIPFIDVDDIARVASIALTTPDSFNRDLLLTGPNSISYDDVAKLISDNIDRNVVHKSLSVEELESRFVNMGMTHEYASGLAGMDVLISQGAEDRVHDDVNALTGVMSNDFESFVLANKHAWIGS